MHNRILLYMLAAFLCFDPAASLAWAAPSTVAAGTQRAAPLPLSEGEAQARMPRQAQPSQPPQLTQTQAQTQAKVISPAGSSAAAQKNKHTASKKGQGNARKKQGISGFSSNPFDLTHRDAPSQTASPPRVSYGAQGRRQAQNAPSRLQVSGHVASVPEDRLVPHRKALPGGPQTLSAIEHDPTPEVSMSYRLDQHTTTKVTINPQDTASPLYRPVENEGTVNSAGVYMNVDVKPDLQLQIGGEYCDVETRAGATSGDGASRGASVGLRWTF